jgi:hypothetical protein
VTRAALFEKLGFGAFLCGLLLWISGGDIFWAMAGNIALFVCLTVFEEPDR